MFNPIWFLAAIFTGVLAFLNWRKKEWIPPFRNWIYGASVLGFLPVFWLFFQVLGMPSVAEKNDISFQSNNSFQISDSLVLISRGYHLEVIRLPNFQLKKKLELKGDKEEAIARGEYSTAFIRSSEKPQGTFLAVLTKEAEIKSEQEIPGEPGSHSLFWIPDQQLYGLSFKMESTEEETSRFGFWTLSEDSKILAKRTFTVNEEDIFKLVQIKGKWTGRRRILRIWMKLAEVESGVLDARNPQTTYCQVRSEESFWGARDISFNPPSVLPSWGDSFCLKINQYPPFERVRVDTFFLPASIRCLPLPGAYESSFQALDSEDFPWWFSRGEDWYAVKRKTRETWGYEREMIVIERYAKGVEKVAEVEYFGSVFELSHFSTEKDILIMCNRYSRHLQLDPISLELKNKTGLTEHINFYLFTYPTRGPIFKSFLVLSLLWPLLWLIFFLRRRKKPQSYRQFMLIGQAWLFPFGLYTLLFLV